jgi:hypothetical protein
MWKAASVAVLAIAITGMSVGRCAEAPPATSDSPTWEADLAPGGEPGASFVLEGRVIGAGGRPTLPDMNAYVRPDTGSGFRCDWDLPWDRTSRLDKRPKAFAPHPR